MQVALNAREAVARALECGCLLNLQKDAIPHGTWQTWLATRCPDIRDTGRMPNRLVIGLPLWNKLCNNAKVIARFPGAASVGVTMAQFPSLLLNPSIDVRVGIMSRIRRNGAVRRPTSKSSASSWSSSTRARARRCTIPAS